MLAQQEVKEREAAQNYPLVAEVMASKTIVVVLAIHEWKDGQVCWCETRPAGKLINVLEKDLRYLEPRRTTGT